MSVKHANQKPTRSNGEQISISTYARNKYKKKNQVYAQVKNQLLKKLKWEKFYKFTYAYSSYDNTWSYDSYPKRARKETKKSIY